MDSFIFNLIFLLSMLSRCYLSLPRSRCLTFAKTMSSTAFTIPFDHQSSAQFTGIDGTDPSKLWSLTPQGEKLPQAGTTRIFYNTPAFKVTTLSSLGEGYAFKKSEFKRELVRKSVGRAQGLRRSERRLGRCVCRSPRCRCVL